jgi:DUF1009 family protein
MPLGIIAGNGSFPLRVAKLAKAEGRKVVVVSHLDETEQNIEGLADHVTWIKVGELKKMIQTFKDHKVHHVIMAGGINRVNVFGGVKLDTRAAALLMRLRSTKDDIIMRGIADELSGEGIEILNCALYFKQCFVKTGVISKRKPSAEELTDIEVGKDAIVAMSAQHIGQVVAVREGVIVAVEAVEGTDKAILRGGELGGKGTVIVKCAKPAQDMRFDIPTVGIKTIETMIAAKASVLALEAERCLLLDEEEVVALANKHGISIVGIEPLV